MADLTSLEDALRSALLAPDDAEAVVGVCAACIDRLPYDGAAITVMTSDVQRQIVYASDDVVAAIERLQYTLGEGPSLLAFTERRPVLVPSARDPLTAVRWPILAGEVTDLAVGSIFCFPMRVGVINVGVCTLYRRSAGDLSASDVSVTLSALELTTLALLDLRSSGDGEHLLGRWLAGDVHSRREVHQATGMLMGQLRVSAEVAFARLRAAAFAAGCDVEVLSARVVRRQLRLES